MSDQEESKGNKTKDLGKQKEKKLKTTGQKLPPADIYSVLTDAINHSTFARVAAPFGKVYKVLEPGPGVRLVVRVEDDVATMVSEEALVHDLVRYTADNFPNATEFHLTHKTATDCMRWWRAYSDPVPEPSMVKWADEPGLTWRKLPWPRNVEGDMPLFTEMFSRISNARAVLAWVGSIMDMSSDCQQYLWIHGGGSDGKSALVRFLRKALGPAYRSKLPPAPDDKHWTAGLIGARLVAFTDCNHVGFPSSGLFKAMSGGDPVDINPKFKDAYTASLKAKYLFLSNEKPNLSSEKADTRRIILAHMESIGCQPDPTYEARLWLEGGAFLALAREAYLEACPNGGGIPVETTELDELVSANEEDFETFFDDHFETKPDQSELSGPVGKLIDERFRDRKMGTRFRSWMERRHGIVRRAVREGSLVSKRYLGLAIKARLPLGESWGRR